MSIEGATVANAFVQVMPSMEGAGTNISNALVPSLTGAGNDAGAQFGSVFAGAAGTALKAAGAALAGVFAVGAMKDAFETVEAGFNNMKIATGATGEQAEALKQVYLDVSKSVSGSFEDIGSAVGELNTRFGLQGEELEQASEQAMKYAKVTGQDATAAIQDVSRMMNNAGISADEYGRVLDTLTVAGQAAGIDVGKLTTTVTDNAASFKELGFSTEESIAMLAHFEKSGANTSAILAGMKKGVAEWAKEGKSAKEGFAEFVSGVESGTVTAQDAIDIFGAKAGVTMFDAAQKGQLSFDEMYAAITEDSAGALDSVYESTLTAQEKFDLLGKKLQAGFFEILEPIVSAIMPYIDAALEGVGNVIEGVVNLIVPFIEEFSAQITPVVDEVLPELQSVSDEVMTSIFEIVKTVWPSIQEVIGSVMEIIGSIMQEAWPIIKEVIVSSAKAVETVIKTVWPSIQNAITAAMNVIKPLIETAWPIIKGIMESAMQAIMTIAQTVWPIISGIVDTAINHITNIINGMQYVVNVVQGIFNGVKHAIEDPIGTARDFIRGAIDTIKGFFNFNISWPHIPLPHFYVSGSINPLDWLSQGPPSFSIDWWSKGGFADEPTVNMNGYGEKGPELYWPSYDPYFDKYAKGIAEHMPANGVDIHDCTFVIREEADVRKVAEQLNTLINRQTAGGIA